VRPEPFIRAHTAIGTAPLVPEIRLHLATEITPIWQATEAWLERSGIEPPFWAFAWPGAQALARLVLDRPELVRDRAVLDFAAGGGLAAIACAMCGARAEAAEIDPLATVEHRDELARALAELSAEEREAIALRFGAELTVPEMAELLREPLTTMEGRVYRALRKLRAVLAEDRPARD